MVVQLGVTFALSLLSFLVSDRWFTGFAGSTEVLLLKTMTNNAAMIGA